MAMPFMKLFGIEPDFEFTIANRSLCDSIAEILRQLDNLLNREQPDILLVQGDTNSVLAAALAAFYHRVRIGHIEAGLRTFRKFFPYPEEMNRLLTTRLADWHFAPTEQAKANLLSEGVPEEDIFVTGNTVIDALRLMTEKIDASPGIGAELQRNYPFLDPTKKLILLTGHRRENQNGGLSAICNALKHIVAKRDDVQIVYPVHRSPRVRAEVLPLLQGIKDIHTTEPQDYLSFIQLLRRSHCVMTDSGGVQEEAAALGKAIILLRDETERPEIAQMTRVIVTGADESKIFNAAQMLLRESGRASFPKSDILGRGDASRQIAKIILTRSMEHKG